MAELPKLPERILRLHSLRWNELIERHGFTGEHLKWHDSPDRRRQAARPRFSLAPPPIAPVTHRTPAERTHFGTDGQRVPYETWQQQQMEEWARRASDPGVIDSIGVAESATLARARFSELVMDYLKFWAAGTYQNSDEFRHWSIGLAQSVTREVGDLWLKDQWHRNWFERACRNKIDEALVPLSKEWASRASRLEIQGVENPQLSIESLLGADGSLGGAATLDEAKRTIEAAQQSLRRSQARGPLTPSGEECGPRQSGRAAWRERQRCDDLLPEPLRGPLVAGVSTSQPVPDTAPRLEATKPAASQKTEAARQGSIANTGTLKPEEILVKTKSARELSEAAQDQEPSRLAMVDAFLLQCNRESAGGLKVIRKHIWLAAGHRHPRQFQFWKTSNDKATKEDDRNFRRILRMPPAEFIALLKKKGIFPSNP